MKRFIIIFVLIFGISIQADAEVLTDSILNRLLEVGLPVVQIETVDGIEPTYEIADPPEGCLGGSIRNASKEPGRIVVMDKTGIIYDSGNYAKDESGMTVRVRGNWSARRPKKPYRIKLQRKADLLGRGDNRYDDKKWLLLPFFDLNELIGLKVNELMALQWTPRFRYVNLVFNGDFRGLYMLMEPVSRNVDCRLNVDKESGYIMELDAYWWNESEYVPSSFELPLHYTFKYPDEDKLTKDQKDYIGRVFQEAEKACLESTGTYENFIDVESFARWMLAHDILGNTDGAGSNIFLTKYDNSEQSLLKMACLWDYEVIMRSEEWDNLHNRYYFGRLFNNSDFTFKKTYVELWNQNKHRVFDELLSFIDSWFESDLRNAVDLSIELNNDRWAKYMYTLPLSAIFINEAKTYFNKRKPWLDNAINGISTSCLWGVNASGSCADSPYYNLAGKKVNTSYKGIVIQNGKKRIARRPE